MKDNEMNEREMKKGEMKVIVGKEFGGERALFAVKNVELRGCTFHPGESTARLRPERERRCGIRVIW